MADRPARITTARWPLMGRHAQLEGITTAFGDPACRAVLINGPPGVGKSRLAEEFVAIAAADGRAVTRAAGSRTVAAVPLGALAHLLPAETHEASTVFDRVSDAFRTQASGRPPVLLVDDLHLLDATSALLLGRLLDDAVAFVVGTVLAGEPLPEPVSAWSRSDWVVGIGLDELSPEELDGLLQQALGGPVAARTIGELWAAGRGNPLYTRELVLAAYADGSLVADSGVWHLTGPLARSPRLDELVAARIEGVQPPARQALELVALVEPVGMAELEPLVGSGTFDELEKAGLLVVRADQRRRQVSLAHPLYGEVLRDRLPVLTRRRLLLAHAERVERRGSRRREDRLRVATWRLAATGTADPDLLLAAARLARYGHDHAQVERLTQAALTVLTAPQGRTEAQLLLGEARYELGSFVQADAALRAAESEASDERQLVQIATTRARTLLDGFLRPDEALAVNRAVRERVTEPDARNELLAVEATLQTLAGRPVLALELLEQLGPAVDLRTRARRAIPEAIALVAVGRCETALKVAREGFVAHTELGDQLAIAHPGTHLINQVYALTQAGRLHEATALATAGYQVANKDRSPIGQIWFTLHLGRCAVLAGRPATARRWLAEASGLCRQYRYRGPHRHALSQLAVATAWLGDAAAARAAVAELDELCATGAYGFHREEQDLGRAWAAWAAGDLRHAREVARAAAVSAAGSGHRSSAAWLLHDLARLGDPAGASRPLQDLALVCEGPLVDAYAVHADGMAAADPLRLAEAGERFEGMGMALFAAEALAGAGRAYRRAGQPRAAAAMQDRATALAAGCEGARTPGLITATAVEPLTRREQEVALLAARGLTSKQIAERLHLSVRTVDSHLQNSYSKLGVTGRDQLQDALTALSDPR